MMKREKKKPLVTIGLPVFNGGDHLWTAVTSIIMQSWTNWELLLLDDGSTDGSVESLFVFDDPRISIILDGSNIGIVNRLNQAVSLARGDYFARMDHDDICHPERLEKQLKYLELNKNIDVVCSRCVTIDGKANLIGSLPYASDHHSICKFPWKGFLMPHPTWVGRTEWFRQNPYAVPEPFRCEDQELILRTFSKSNFHTIPENLLAYRKSGAFKIRTLIKTNFSWFFVQARYFYSQKLFLFVLLCFSVMLMRLFKSALLDKALNSQKYQIFVKPRNKNAYQQNIAWQKIFDDIDRLKESLLSHNK